MDDNGRVKPEDYHPSQASGSEWVPQIKALQVLRDDLRRHDDGGTLVGTYAHGRLTEGAMNLRQGPLHALPFA